MIRSNCDSRTRIEIDGRRTRARSRCGMAVAAHPRVSAERRHVAPQLERVPVGWRFIAPDLRGFGAATVARADAQIGSLDDYARISSSCSTPSRSTSGDRRPVDGRLRHLRAVSPAPDRFTAMILADTKRRPTRPRGARRASMRELLAKRGPAAVADQMLPKLLSRGHSILRPELVEETRRLIVANTIRRPSIGRSWR